MLALDGGTAGFFDGEETLQTSKSFSEFASDSESESDSVSESTTHSRSLVPTLVPVFGKELAHVQFRSLEEQLFRAMAVLFDQKERQGVGRLVGMSAPISIYTPTINKPPTTPARLKRYIEACYAKLPYALTNAKAQQQLTEREQNFTSQMLNDSADEPMKTKRQIR